MNMRDKINKFARFAFRGRGPRPAALGIPRAMFYFLYPGLWETFFEALGVPVVLSEPTARATLDRAGLVSETEHCLPAKLLDAHLDDLGGKTPRVLVPRVLSMRRGCISCPKMAALPDAVRAQFGERFEVVTIDVDENERPLRRTLAALGKQLGFGSGISAEASNAACCVMEAREKAYAGEHASGSGKSLLLIGHPYNLDDEYLADPVMHALRAAGARVGRIDYGMRSCGGGPLKWDMCAVMLEALHVLDAGSCAGVIQLTSFNCGCDSMAGVFYRSLLKRKGIPYMTLTLDTHAAPGGLETRLEAFVDSIGENA